MLSIWIGRAGAGKSRRVLETMARQRSQRPQVLLVPEHISHEAEVDLCRALGPTASRDAEVLSFQSLGSRVLARTGGLAEFTLDGGGKLLTMRLALQELHSRLKVFGRPSQRAAFLRQLTDLTEEFYAYEITPQTLWQQVENMEGAMGDKLRDLALLYAAYDGKLHAEGVDARSRLQKLRDRLAESDYLRGKDVYLDGFSYLNKLEESVLEQVMRQFPVPTELRPQLLHTGKEVQKPWFLLALLPTFPAIGKSRPPEARSCRSYPPERKSTKREQIPTISLRPGSE